jgi:hypothetical protein
MIGLLGTRVGAGVISSASIRETIVMRSDVWERFSKQRVVQKDREWVASQFEI